MGFAYWRCSGPWLHQNDKLFNGSVASTDGVAYAVEGFVTTWFSRPGGGGSDILVTFPMGQSPIFWVTVPFTISKKKKTKL